MSEKWNVYESFQALLKAGTYHLALEGCLILWIIWLLTKTPKSRHAVKLSKKEEQQLLSEWTPEPLIPNPPDPSHPDLHTRIVDGKIGMYITLGKKKVLNLATHNYLNFSSRPEIEKSALDCLNIYGVGSCGPRGFYGTSEVHLKLEERIALFYNCETAALYSYGFSTIASAIPAYAKKGDIIYADECVNFAIQRGMDASRSKLVYFRHNDVNHLEELLQSQAILDKKDPKKAAATRKFLVAEGVYVNTGRLCPLPDLVALRARYKLRLFLDESVSFATLGDSARGALDHHGIAKEEVDLIMVSLEHAAASSGGFTVGTKFVVEHQRLNGLGYCFSASLPPMLAAASIKAFDILEEEGPDLVTSLQKTCQKVHRALSNISDAVRLVGDPISAVKHLELAERLERREDELALLRGVVERAEEEGVAVVIAAHLATLSHRPPPPSIRIAVNKDLSDHQIGVAARALQSAFAAVLPPHQDS